MNFELVIRGGAVFDGSGWAGGGGAEKAVTDVAVLDGRIAEVGDGSSWKASREIDARDRVVCPGFIDIHGHSDVKLLVNPRCESKLLQGVTTEVGGNCGLSGGPVFAEATEHARERCKRLGLELDWSDMDSFLKKLEEAPRGINFVPLVGLGNIRGSIVGYAQRDATEGELARMKHVLRDELAAGAWGVSTGLIYPPGCFASAEEITELVRVAAGSAGLYTTHMRNEGDRLVEAVEEALSVGRDTGVRVQISHLKAGGKKNWSKMDDCLGLIREERARGTDVWCDRYPYLAGYSSLDMVLPSWVYDGGREEELKRLRDRGTRRRITWELDRMYQDPADWDEVMVASVKSEENKHLEGKRLGEVAAMMKSTAASAVIDLLVEEELHVGAVYFGMTEENLHKVLSQEFCLVGSDSSVYASRSIDGFPHPRAFGTFPRVLGKFVREQAVLEQGAALSRMTGLVAQRIGLPDRGRILPGQRADIVVFDPATIEDTASYEEPTGRPRGIDLVVVNGTVSVEMGEVTGQLGGMVLRRAAQDYSPG